MTLDLDSTELPTDPQPGETNGSTRQQQQTRRVKKERKRSDNPLPKISQVYIAPIVNPWSAAALFVARCGAGQLQWERTGGPVRPPRHEAGLGAAGLRRGRRRRAAAEQVRADLDRPRPGRTAVLLKYLAVLLCFEDEKAVEFPRLFLFDY